MSIGALPETLSVGGVDYSIRTDYRNVLDVFEAFSDPELDDYSKNIIAVYMMFEDFRCADDVYDAVGNGFDLAEALNQIMWFIPAGNPGEQKEIKPTYDWEQDEQMIFSAINKVAKEEVRAVDYMHWWTFLGFFHEVEEGIFTHVVNIRQKLNNGKKLEKWEQEFYSKNKDIIDIKKRQSEEEIKEEERQKARAREILGF